MAARTPPVTLWTAGQRVTAAQLQFLMNPPMFRMYQSVSQSVAGSTYVQITCDISEYDSDSGRSGSTPWSFTIPAGMSGRWRLTGMVSWTGNATGVRIAALYKNGTQINGANAAVQAAPAGNATNVLVSSTPTLSAGDVIGLYGWQNSGGSLSTQTGGSFPSFLEGCLVSLANP